MPTIGYGFTEGVKLGDTITPKAAGARLLIELTHVARSVYAFCSSRVSQNQLDAMTSLAYNIGLTAFARSSVLKTHNSGAKEAALYLSTEK